MLKSRKKKRENISEEIQEELLEKIASKEDVATDEEDSEHEENSSDELAEILDNDEIKHLKDEIEALKSALEAKKKEQERIFAGLAEFAMNFSKVSMDSIPDEVWESVKNGASLSDAYSLYEKKREADESIVREVNRINAERSSGAISSAADGGYYSPDEVRKMTAYEVKKNYKLIIESMKKWN